LRLEDFSESEHGNPSSITFCQLQIYRICGFPFVFGFENRDIWFYVPIVFNFECTEKPIQSQIPWAVKGKDNQPTFCLLRDVMANYGLLLPSLRTDSKTVLSMMWSST
jgi:hypothetical protein